MLEESGPGRAVLTLLMAVLVAAVVAWNLPSGPAHDAVRPAAGPVLLPIGLDQDWALFAPDPRSFSVGVYARITFADGSQARWTPPHNGHWLLPYRSYRWQKYVERLRADDYQALWEPTARWVARQTGRATRQVVLVRTFRDAVPPGSGARRGPTQEYAFYTLDLP